MKRNRVLIISTILVIVALFFILKGIISGTSNERPNIILITIETLRTDHMSAYGYEIETTPNIDNLAKEGVLFSNYIGKSGDSGASIASLFTSEYPGDHGVHTVGTSMKLNETTLTEVLKKEGYTTFGIVPMFFLSRMADTNYDQGFEIYAGPKILGKNDQEVIVFDAFVAQLFSKLIDISQGVDKESIISGLIQSFTELIYKNRVSNKRYNKIAIAKELAPLVEDIMGEFKDYGKENKPFFIWAHLWGAHAPYWGSRDVYAHPNTQEFCKEVFEESKYDLTNYSNPSMKNSIHELSDWAKGIKSFGEPITELNLFKALYDESISSTDQYIGDMIKKLKEEGLLENTIIVITADHGESLGNDGIFFYHGYSTKDYMLKLPLIIYYPKKLGHKVINYQTTELDVMPTILDLAGINRKGLDLRGKNLLGGGTEYAFLETMYCNRKINPKCYPEGKEGQQKAIRSNEYKLIMTPTQEGKIYELFNLKIDPNELNNIYKENNKTAQILKSKLEEWTIQGQEYRNREDEMSNDVRESLKKLGYIK